MDTVILRGRVGFLCWGGQGSVNGSQSSQVGRRMEAAHPRGARANVRVLGGLWMLLTGVENFLCEKMFFGSFF